jgi:hypothetical protein
MSAAIQVGVEPPLDRRGPVCGSVIGHHVHVQIGGHFGADLARERQEPSELVTGVECADDLPGREI